AHIADYTTVQKNIDGRSLVGLLEGNSDNTWNARSLVWHIPNKWTTPDGPGINFFSAIRQGDFKLVYNMKQAKLELYNLAEDIGETNDIAGKNKKKVKELSDILSEKLKTWDAQLPSYKLNGKQVPYPNQLN
ncbi:MAG: sulfatase, partial [Sphingobacterium sp.]